MQMSCPLLRISSYEKKRLTDRLPAYIHIQMAFVPRQGYTQGTPEPSPLSIVHPHLKLPHQCATVAKHFVTQPRSVSRSRGGEGAIWHLDLRRVFSSPGGDRTKSSLIL